MGAFAAFHAQLAITNLPKENLHFLFFDVYLHRKNKNDTLISSGGIGDKKAWSKTS